MGYTYNTCFVLIIRSWLVYEDTMYKNFERGGLIINRGLIIRSGLVYEDVSSLYKIFD